MISADTNVLVRALIDDPGEPRQTAAARASLKKAGEVYVTQIVQVELVWVLEAAHALRREEVLGVLEHLQNNAAFHLQHRDHFDAAVDSYRVAGADFSDYLILAESKARGAELLTFDKRLLKSTGTKAP